jgi:hypothetical protein
MGYDTRHTGEIRIEPPIPYDELAGSPFLVEPRQVPERDLKLRVEEWPVRVNEETLYRRAAVAVMPISDSPYKGYEIEDHLRELVGAFPNHRFLGRLECHGAEAGDFWRLVATGHDVHREKA